MIHLALALTSSLVTATSAGVAPSPMSGNGHNVTFDGRLFIAAHGNGWNAMVLRPELVTPTDTFVDMSNAFSEPTLIQPNESCENALAICEENADDVPYACDDAGNRNDAGGFACYDVVVIDSNACGTEIGR